MISEPIQVCYSNFSPFPNPAVLNIPRRYSDNKIVNKPASPMRKRTRFETAMIFRPILPLPPRSVFARSRSTVYFVIAVGYSVISVELIYSNRVNVSRQSADYGERYVRVGGGGRRGERWVLAWLARRDRVESVYAGVQVEEKFDSRIRGS